MSRYVIRRTDQGGGYVTPPGSSGSYTYDLTKAWTFPSKEVADRQRCPGNEVVVPVESLLQVPHLGNMGTKDKLLACVDRAKKIIVHVRLNFFTYVPYEPPIHGIKAAIYRKFKQPGAWQYASVNFTYEWDESQLLLTFGISPTD